MEYDGQQLYSYQPVQEGKAIESYEWFLDLLIGQNELEKCIVIYSDQ